MKIKKKIGGGVGVRSGGGVGLGVVRLGCERRIEVFVSFFCGGGGGHGGRGRVRVYVNEELKFL